MPTTFVVIIVVLLAACVGGVLGRASSRPTPTPSPPDGPDHGEAARLVERLEVANVAAASADAEIAALRNEIASLHSLPPSAPDESDALRLELSTARERERAQTAQLMATSQELAALAHTSERANALTEQAEFARDAARQELSDTQERLIALVNEREALLEGGSGAAALRRKVQSLQATQEQALRRAAELEAELGLARRTSAHRLPSTDGELSMASSALAGVATTTNGHAPSMSRGQAQPDPGAPPDVEGSSVANLASLQRAGLDGEEPDIDLVS